MLKKQESTPSRGYTTSIWYLTVHVSPNNLYFAIYTKMLAIDTKIDFQISIVQT